MLKILSVFDEYENFKRHNKLMVGKIEHLKLNKWKGGKINFGYKIGENSKIEIDHEDSKVVKKLFDLYNKGGNLEELKIYLNTHNILPPTSTKKLWNTNSLKNILRNEIYIGKINVEVKLLKNRSKEYCREKGKIINITQYTPRIISDKVFKSVNEKIELNSRSKKGENNLKYDYLLRGKCFCGYCGGKMLINSNKNENKKVFYCGWSVRKFKGDESVKCGKDYSRQINIDVVEDLVWNELIRCFKESYKVKEEFRKESLEVIYNEKETPKLEIEKNKKSIKHYYKNILRLEDNLVELLRKKLTLNLSEKHYLSLEGSINEEIKVYRNKILEIEKRIEIINNGIEWYDWLDEFDKLYDTIKNYRTFKQKHSFITKYINKVDVDWDKDNSTHTLTITFNMNIVRDERIRKEKYVFELLEGTNVSEIHNINHTKLNNQLKKKNKLNSVVQNHSTVTDLARLRG
jgi:hypothetical protein